MQCSSQIVFFAVTSIKEFRRSRMSVELWFIYLFYKNSAVLDYMHWKENCVYLFIIGMPLQRCCSMMNVMARNVAKHDAVSQNHCCPFRSGEPNMWPPANKQQSLCWGRTWGIVATVETDMQESTHMSIWDEFAFQIYSKYSRVHQMTLLGQSEC